MAKALLISSALFLGLLGITGTFLPQEVLNIANVAPSRESVVLLQIMGGLYMGFGLLNWMVRHAPMGGIYGKPISMANLVHFLVVGLMLIKEVSKGDLGNGFIILSVCYAVFGLGFAATLFFDPLSRRSK